MSEETEPMGDGEFVVRRVVGTGDPLDVLFMMPLVHQWGAARACSMADNPACDAPIARIVILDEPGITDDNGVTSSVLAFCEADYLSAIASLRKPVTP